MHTYTHTCMHAMPCMHDSTSHSSSVEHIPVHYIALRNVDTYKGYNTIQNKRKEYNAVTIPYSTIPYSTIQCNTVQYNAIQYNTRQCDAIRHNTVRYKVHACMRPCRHALLHTCTHIQMHPCKNTQIHLCINECIQCMLICTS